MTMNTENRHTALLASIIGVLTLCLVGCSADEPLTPSVPEVKGESMRFTTSVSPGSRTVHTGMESSFVEGESVGCIIAVKDKNDNNNFQYKANSQWHYHVDGHTGVLVLDNIWGEKINAYGKYPQNEMTGLKLLQRHPEYAEESGFLELLDENASYAFYFYYPYIDNDILKQDLAEAVTEWNQNRSKEFHTLPGFPQRILYKEPKCPTGTNDWDRTDNLDTSDQSLSNFIIYNNCVGEIYDKYKASGWGSNGLEITRYGWEQYPFFVNNTQRTKRQFSNSDFLCVSYTANVDDKGGVTKEHETRPVPLTFRRMNAAIELQSDVELPMNSVWFENTETGIVRGRAINLRTGATSEYPNKRPNWDESNDDLLQRLSVVTKYKFYPLPMDAGYDEANPDGAYKTYRLILPAQDNFKANLSFSLNGKSYTIDLSSQLTRLERNKLYIIRLNARGDWDIIIKPWQDDTSNILIENEPREE